jgi:hypothetical protein
MSSNLNRFNALHEVSYMIKKDIDKCSVMSVSGENQIDLLTRVGTVRYRFFTNRVIREQNSRVDEYGGTYRTAEFFFQASPVTEGNRVIDEIRIKTQPGQLIEEFVFFKKYDIASMIQFDTIDRVHE